MVCTAFRMVLVVVCMILGGALACPAGPLNVCPPQGCRPPVRVCPPPPAPIKRTVTVDVPMPCPPPPVCRPAPPSCGPCPPPKCAPPPCPPPVRTRPVQVEVSVRPDTGCKERLTPIVYRDPGPIKPVINSAVDLTGAAVALPFRVLEMFVPNPKLKRQCPRPMMTAMPCAPPVFACGPTPVAKCRPAPRPCAPPVSYCRPVVNPTVCAPPAPCRTPVTCGPPGPLVAPYPRPQCMPVCGRTGPIPPAIVRESSQFPPVEPDTLLGAVWNLPGRLLTRARWTGDLFDARSAGCAPRW